MGDLKDAKEDIYINLSCLIKHLEKMRQKLKKSRWKWTPPPTA